MLYSLWMQIRNGSAVIGTYLVGEGPDLDALIKRMDAQRELHALAGDINPKAPCVLFTVIPSREGEPMDCFFG